MGVVDVDKATSDFAEKLDSGYFVSRADELKHLNSLSAVVCDYDEYQAQRDTKAVEEFVSSDVFQQCIASL